MLLLYIVSYWIFFICFHIPNAKLMLFITLCTRLQIKFILIWFHLARSSDTLSVNVKFHLFAWLVIIQQSKLALVDGNVICRTFATTLSILSQTEDNFHSITEHQFFNCLCMYIKKYEKQIYNRSFNHAVLEWQQIPFTFSIPTNLLYKAHQFRKLNVSLLFLKLSFLNPLNPDVKSRMKM